MILRECSSGIECETQVHMVTIDDRHNLIIDYMETFDSICQKALLEIPEKLDLHGRDSRVSPYQNM